VFKHPILKEYDEQGHPYFASARLWDDGIINLTETRQALALGISMSLNASIPEYHMGVFRM
jgi:3-methylcrotonyl-CoA carboxylase beta subunit